MNKIKLLLFSLTLYISGFILTFAKDNSVAMTENIKTFSENIVNNVLSSAGTLLMTAAFIIFMYGIVVFIYQKSTGKGDSNEAKKGKDFMLWGLIALFVMVSAWGIIKLFQEMFSIEGGNIQIEAVSFAPLATTDSKKDETKDETKDDTKDETKKDDTDNKEDFSKYPVLKRGIEFDDNLYAFLKSLTIILYQKNCSTRNFASKANLFDEVTETAVKKFQAANNLNDDGIVGKDTWEALYTPAESKTSKGLTVKNC